MKKKTLGTTNLSAHHLAILIATCLLFLLPFPATAQRKAGELYVQGLRAQQAGDVEKAYHYFLQSATESDARAYDCLAECYQKGLGVKKDAKKAFDWYEKAAKEDIKHKRICQEKRKQSR